MSSASVETSISNRLLPGARLGVGEGLAVEQAFVQGRFVFPRRQFLFDASTAASSCLSLMFGSVQAFEYVASVGRFRLQRQKARTEGELSAIWDHLLPAFGATPLPADPAGQAKVNEAVAALVAHPQRKN